MRPCRDGIAVMAFEIVVPPQAAIATKLQRQIGHRHRIVDHHMANGQRIRSHPLSRIDITGNGKKQAPVCCEKHLDLAKTFLNTRNGGERRTEAYWCMARQMAQQIIPRRKCYTMINGRQKREKL